MSELFFVIKTAVFSAIVLMLLQMKIGGTTLEQHSEAWIYGSRVGTELQTVARGAVRAGHEGFAWIRNQTGEKTEAVETNRERFQRSRSRSSEILD